MSTHVSGWIAGLLLALAASVSAHHNVAQSFDTTAPVALEGALTKVGWKDPHVILHVATKGADGRALTWSVETLSPQGLALAGLTADSFKIGEALRAVVCVKKDGAPWAVTSELLRSGGSVPVSVGGC